MDKSIQTPLEYHSSVDEKKKCNKYTDEEKAERARTSTSNYYYKNKEKDKTENDYIIMASRNRLNNIFFGYQIESPVNHLTRDIIHGNTAQTK